jgi:hypothetical protein
MPRRCLYLHFMVASTTNCVQQLRIRRSEQQWRSAAPAGNVSGDPGLDRDSSDLRTARILRGFIEVDSDRTPACVSCFLITTAPVELQMSAVAENLQALSNLSLNMPILRESLMQRLRNCVNVGQRKHFRELANEKLDRQRPRNVRLSFRQHHPTQIREKFENACWRPPSGKTQRARASVRLIAYARL